MPKKGIPINELKNKAVAILACSPSLKQLAHLAAIKQWKRGRVKGVTEQTLKKVCEEIKISEYDFKALCIEDFVQKLANIYSVDKNTIMHHIGLDLKKEPNMSFVGMFPDHLVHINKLLTRQINVAIQDRMCYISIHGKNRHEKTQTRSSPAVKASSHPTS